MTGETPTSQEAINRLVSEFLELLPESTQRVVRLSSIPNAINFELLQNMTGDETAVGDILELLQQYYFLNKGQGGWYYFSAEIREFLRAFWIQPGQLEEFQSANRIAIAYFDRLAEQAPPPGNYVFQREALYHHLLDDEHAGLEYMADLFERALDQRQIGPAQNFSIQLAKTLPELSPVAGQHASYYEMRLDFMLNRRKDLEEKLETLIRETPDALLRARAGTLLGQLLLTKYEWKKARDVLTASLKVFENLMAWRYAARALLSLGDIYINLVENSGGVQPESSNDRSRWNQFLTRVLFLPYLFLDWLRRKIWFLPGWFYFGGNYQEWILNYLLQMAGTWYRKAWNMAQKAEDDITSLNALLGQANVAVQQRREAKARRIYSRLAQLPAVHSSAYRSAQVLSGQGQVSLMANDASQARQELEGALNLFRSFADETNVGMVARVLGTTNLLLADPEAAARAFLESFQAYRETHNLVLQTQVSWELERLIEKPQLSRSMEQQIEEALSRIQEKQYIARFPSDLLRRFRTMAYWVALPLSYFMILFVGVIACVALIVIEYLILQYSDTGVLSRSDILFLFVVGILPIFTNFWIVELVYAGIGQIWVFMAGRSSLNSLGEQPDRIILTADEIVVDTPGLQEPIRLMWNEIQSFVSADFKVWQRPIHLFSRLGLVSNRQSMIIDGITSGYRQLRKEIGQRLGNLVDQPKADLVILTHLTTYIAVLVAILHAQILILLDKMDITVLNEETGRTQYLFLSRLLVFFIVNITLIFPPLLLWRVNLQRRFFSRKLGKPPRRLLNLAAFSIAIFLTAVALLWLVISPFL